MDEPIVTTPKKKKKYGKRCKVKLIVNGKIYRGNSMHRENGLFVLKTEKGSVYINQNIGVVEVVGEVEMQRPASAGIPLGPGTAIVTGGAASFNARRNAALDAMTSMPELGGAEA